MVEKSNVPHIIAKKLDGVVTTDQFGQIFSLVLGQNIDNLFI